MRFFFVCVFLCLIGLAAAVFPSVTISEKSPESICDAVKQYAGYVTVSRTKNLFYWFFESRNSPSSDPLVIWLTGGPGCSSLIALFGENGPCSVNEQGTDTIKNQFSWNANANIMWIDQPVGTGWSYGSPLDYDEKQVADDLYGFLQGWFTLHPEYLSRKFFVTGESYAGHYVPAVSSRIFQGNKNNEGKKINLGGCAIGNGLTDPEVQYGYYAEMAWNNSVGPIVDRSTYESMVRATPGCLSKIKECNDHNTGCSTAQFLCNIGLLSPVQQTGINLYDIREKCKVPPLCYDFSNVDKYIQRPEVRQALGVGNNKWHGDCNYAVNGDFRNDWMKNYQQDLPDLLGANLTVLIYAGEDDFICNYKGNRAWTLVMDWPGKDGFNSAPDHPWNVDGKEAGIAKTYKGFTFLQVHEAGHMVPLNQPKNALAMVNQFLKGTPF